MFGRAITTTASLTSTNSDAIGITMSGRPMPVTDFATDPMITATRTMASSPPVTVVVPSRRRAGGDRPVRVGRPRRPRTDVQPGTSESDVLHRERVVAGGDARAAVDDRIVVGRGDGEPLGEFCRRAEVELGVEVLGVDEVDRSGNVAGDGIDRLDVTGVAGRGRGCRSPLRRRGCVGRRHPRRPPRSTATGARRAPTGSTMIGSLSTGPSHPPRPPSSSAAG